MTIIDEKISNLIKNNKIIAVTLGVSLILYMIVSSYTNNFLQKFEDKKNAISFQISNAINRYDQQEKKIEELEEAKKLWNKIEKLRNERDNLNYDKVSQIIQAINQDRWLIGKVKISISPPTDVKFPGFSNIGASKSQVTLTFTTMSDITLFNVIDKINNNFPGFIIYKTLSIRKLNEPNFEILDNIRKGKLPTLITCRLVFEWQNLKDLNNV